MKFTCPGCGQCEIERSAEAIVTGGAKSVLCEACVENGVHELRGERDGLRDRVGQRYRTLLRLAWVQWRNEAKGASDGKPIVFARA